MNLFKWSKQENSSKKNRNTVNRSETVIEVTRKDSFVQKVDVSKRSKKTRKDILIDIKREIILKAIAEPNNYQTLQSDIHKVYDRDGVLSLEDMETIECLYWAIRQGNMQVYNTSENKIIEFLKERPDHIVKLVNMMIKEAREINEHVHNEQKKEKDLKTLIADTYDDVVVMVEDIQEQEEQQEI